jgi:hypothetical protein
MRKIKGHSQARTLSGILSEKIQFDKSRVGLARGIKSGQRKLHEKAKLVAAALKPKIHVGRSRLGAKRSRNRALESRKPSRTAAPQSTRGPTELETHFELLVHRTTSLPGY